MNRRWLLRFNAFVFALLFVALLGALSWLSTRYTVQWQWSDPASYGLSDASKRLLSQLDGEVTAVAFTQSGHLLDRHLHDLLGHYAEAKADFRISFINPDARPDLVRELGIKRIGEVVLQYRGSVEQVEVPTEPHVSAALERLLRGQDQFVAYLAGHGERDLLGEANHDLGTFGQALRDKGYRVQPLNFARTPGVPMNTMLLVIAGSQLELLPGEQRILQEYLDMGGNLLWLADPHDAAYLPVLAQRLGFEWLPGVLVDPRAPELLAVDDPRLIVLEDYAGHPATAKLSGLTLLPQSAALKPQQGFEWQPVLTAADHQWLVKSFTPGTQLPPPQRPQEPLWLAASLSRPMTSGIQRIVVVGDGDFLSNQFVGNGINLQLGLNLVDWLTQSEQFLDSYNRAVADQVLQFSKAHTLLIGFGFLLVLPLAFSGVAGWLWWRRRAG